MADKKRVLFLCVGNSCRSQMAEGLLRHAAPDIFDAHSAGSQPVGLNPRAVAVLKEMGVDISAHYSKSLDKFRGERFDYVITVCDESLETQCPVFLGDVGQTLHVPFDDPAGAHGDEDEILYTFRRVRDEISEWITSFAMHEAHSLQRHKV
ncbi:MAG: arsenate reductase ArsC [Pirellulales bacterium]|nr:arsenate reductase ArsC [Pirellulales bacterium]